MQEEHRTTEDLLLGWHLDLLGVEERERLGEALARDPELRTRCDRLGRLLRPLDHWTTPPMPTSLADKVLDRIQRAAPNPIVRLPLTETQAGARGSRFLSLRDLAAVAACLVLLMGVMVPGLSSLRGRSQRNACGQNLASIYQGVRAYQQAFLGSLPYAGRVQGASWLPSGPKATPFSSNSRHVFLLIKTQYGPGPEKFVCPTSPTAEAMDLADAAGLDDFKSPRNICYDSLNLAGSSPNLRPDGRLAYMSDPNPLFATGRFDESLDADQANSPAHGGDGQTVLSLDGGVGWTTSPIYGPRRDNLWTVRGINRYDGTETPADENDVFLIPGFPQGNAAHQVED